MSRIVPEFFLLMKCSAVTGSAFVVRLFPPLFVTFRSVVKVSWMSAFPSAISSLVRGTPVFLGPLVRLTHR